MSQIRYLERLLLTALMLSMPFVYTISVLLSLFDSSLAKVLFWVDEFVRFQLVALVFIGLGYVHDKGAHIVMDVLSGRVGPKMLVGLALVINLLGLLLAGYLGWLGMLYVERVMASGQLSNSLGIPMYWLYLAFPIGAALLALRHLIGIRRIFCGARDTGREEVTCC